MKMVKKSLLVFCCICILLSCFVPMPAANASRSMMEGRSISSCIVTPVAAYASTEAGVDFCADYAIDSNEQTCWSSSICDTSGGNDVEWIYVDLGRTMSIGRILLTPRSRNGVVYGFPVDFRLQYSNDASNWVDIPGHNYTGYTNPTTTDRTFTFQIYVHARYFRVYVTKESTDDGGHYYAQLSEIKLFRTPIQSCREEYPAGAVASSTESAGHSAEMCWMMKYGLFGAVRHTPVKM